MLKYDKGGLPHSINNLFALNNERHNYNTRHNHDLKINTGNEELFINVLVFMVYTYGIIYRTKFQLMYDMLGLRTYQNLIYKTMI